MRWIAGAHSVFRPFRRVDQIAGRHHSLHFGLGPEKEIRAIEIRWPRGKVSARRAQCKPNADLFAPCHPPD